MSFASVYPLYLKKVERKGRSKEEVDALIFWLTGYDEAGLEKVLEEKLSMADFFQQAPAFNPSAELIKGTICGVRIEEIQDPLMQKIRYLDKIIDELARGKSLDKIRRD
ncbi:hypothetical protein ABID29_000350 [Streptococcus rupicaprae]|uniref:DUF2200 domain-containing protein n=1 Tax=Streptococcus rupicaprae TaxID=759619 RepID=A0ABV2FFC6_9STRE